MAFEKISIKEIRPFIRCAINTEQLVHTGFVVPLEHRIFFLEQGSATFWIANNCYKLFS